MLLHYDNDSTSGGDVGKDNPGYALEHFFGVQYPGLKMAMTYK